MIQLERLHSHSVEEFLLTRLAFSPDGASIAIGHKNFRILDCDTGSAGPEFRFGEFLAGVRFSPDGRLIAAANVGDNHPHTRGKIAVFDAFSAVEKWSAVAPRPVETMAINDSAIHWNGGGAIAGARLDSGEPLSPLPVADLQVLALARAGNGFACFAREAVGTRQQIEGADLIFRKFHLRTLGPGAEPLHDVDLGIGAGVHALSPDGKLLGLEVVDFKNNERHVSLVDSETGVEANLLALEANTLPVLGFGLDSKYFLCMKEDAESSLNRLRIWRTSDLALVGEAELDISYHTMAACLEHSLLAFLGGGKLDLFSLN